MLNFQEDRWTATDCSISENNYFKPTLFTLSMNQWICGYWDLSIVLILLLLCIILYFHQIKWFQYKTINIILILTSVNLITVYLYAIVSFIADEIDEENFYFRQNIANLLQNCSHLLFNYALLYFAIDKYSGHVSMASDQISILKSIKMLNIVLLVLAMLSNFVACVLNYCRESANISQIFSITQASVVLILSSIFLYHYIIEKYELVSCSVERNNTVIKVLVTEISIITRIIYEVLRIIDSTKKSIFEFKTNQEYKGPLFSVNYVGKASPSDVQDDARQNNKKYKSWMIVMSIFLFIQDLLPRAVLAYEYKSSKLARNQKREDMLLQQHRIQSQTENQSEN